VDFSEALFAKIHYSFVAEAAKINGKRGAEINEHL